MAAGNKTAENVSRREPISSLYVRTPLIKSTVMSQRAGCNVYLKLENTQPSASFKLRGISNSIKKAMARGSRQLVMSSGGNAGFAAAYIARKLSIPITIYIPRSTPDFVKHRLEAEGASVVVHGSVWDDAEAKARQDSTQPGVAYLHPFDDPDVWEGHASLIAEVAEDLPEAPDLIVVAVGGGGLLCGVVQGMDAAGWGRVPILAMETVGADSYNKAVRAGRLITLPDITSVAKCLGALTVAQQAVDYYKTRPILSQVITDKQSIDACLMFLDDHRMLVEPACGAALAAVYSNILQSLQSQNKIDNIRSVVIIVCGGGSIKLENLLALKKQFDL